MRNQDRNIMRSVKLDRKELLKIVKDNRAKHIEDHKEAIKDYKMAVATIAKDNLKVADTGDLDKFHKLKPFPHAPVSYASSYDRSLRMLELSIETVVELEEQIFNQLVLDEWQWKQAFTTMNAAYKSF